MNQKELIAKIQKAADIIAQKSRSGSGDWIILSSAATKILEHYRIQQERKEKLRKIKKASK